MAVGSIDQITVNGNLVDINPYQYYAADIDEDGDVDIQDAMDIYLMALDRSSAPADKWIFIDESVDFFDGSSYTVDDLNIDWSIVNKAQSSTAGSVNFVAVQKGDIDGDWATANNISSTDAAELDRLGDLVTQGYLNGDTWWA